MPLLFDVVIIGSGLAGLSTALRLSPKLKIALLCKGDLWDSASGKAQGGIAAVKDKTDSFSAHIQDTLVAGAGLCEEKTVRYIVKNAPDALDWLHTLGIPFKKHDSGLWHLHKEGGHTHRRIAHVGDKSGHEIISHLIKILLNRDNIAVFEQVFCQDLIIENKQNQQECLGVHLINQKDLSPFDVLAQHTILATGGIGQIFSRSSNPKLATADGLAMAFRAGCTLANMEFIQFHPTVLALPNTPAFLISEALRGEGALLTRSDGSRFMPDYDDRAELAPRDIVARAINTEILKQDGQPLFLDITHQSDSFITQYFPDIHATCLSYGLDICKNPIPIAPAEHYSCGGVYTNLRGQTEIHHLYAVGEVAYTGLHGANRLASNSLLECVVIGHAIAEAINTKAHWTFKKDTVTYQSKLSPMTCHQILAPKIPNISLSQLQKNMTENLGIVRSNTSLKMARNTLKCKNQRDDTLLHPIAQQELNNMTETALLIIESASRRTESRGLHFNKDYPHLAQTPKISTIKRAYDGMNRI